MRVVFVEVDTERSWSVASIGPGFLAAYLRQHGHEVGFVRATVAMSDAEVVAAVVAAGPSCSGSR
jgi:anaerobic magnesium-protoporphyrin IX monomethyl ester cyclase